MDCSDNNINDLLELSMCESLIEINLEGNLLTDEDNLSFLANLKKLKKLNINNNPLTEKKNLKELLNKYLPELNFF